MTDEIDITVSDQPITVELVEGQGPAGLSAYALAVESGFGGTEAQWLSSLGFVNALIFG